MSVLKRNFLGIEFKNPILPASGCCNMGKEIGMFFPLSTFGGFITKGVSIDKWLGNKTPRCVETVSGMINAVGLQNPGFDNFVKNDLSYLQDKGIPIIANVWAKTKEDFERVVAAFDKTNVDAIEVNISCPNLAKGGGGSSFGVDPDAVFNIISALRKLTKKKMIVKLGPNFGYITQNAQAAERAGADAISLINTAPGMAIDINTKKPILGNKVGGLSGPAIKPIALKMVWEVYNAIKIPIIGIGGISNATDVIEFMLCGASMVEIGTLLLHDPMQIPKIISDLEEYCKKNNITNLDEVVGKLQWN